VHGCLAQLVFNLDEVGISDWEDRQSKKLVVPVSAREGRYIRESIED
jgi:hypothetical protein